MWTNYTLPHLIESGAIGGPAETGKKNLLRIRWLFIVTQMGGPWNQRRCISLGNRMLMDEDFFGESETDDETVNAYPPDDNDDEDDTSDACGEGL